MKQGLIYLLFPTAVTPIPLDSGSGGGGGGGAITNYNKKDKKIHR